MIPELLALKRATAEMIKGVGGLEAAAGFCRVGKSVLGDNQSANRPDSFVAADVIADLEPLARGREGWPHVTRALAARSGFALVKLPEALPMSTELLALVAQQAKQNGEIAGSICSAVAEHSEGGTNVTAAQAAAIRPQVLRLLEVAVAMDAALAAIEAGDGH